jgi:hypothetical protein
MRAPCMHAIRLQVRTSIVGGMLIPLAMFLAWEAAILGSMPATHSDVAATLVDPLEALQVREHMSAFTQVLCFSPLFVLHWG